MTSSHELIRGLPHFFSAFTRRLCGPLVVLHGSYLQPETKVLASTTGACFIPAQVSPRCGCRGSCLSSPDYCFNRFFIGEVFACKRWLRLCPNLAWGNKFIPPINGLWGFFVSPNPFTVLKLHDYPSLGSEFEGMGNRIYFLVQIHAIQI